jgi:hypothetical protein
MRTFGSSSSPRFFCLSFLISRPSLTRIATSLMLSAIGVGGTNAIAQTRPATATTLSVTSSSGTATTVTNGTAVTLSASVTAGSTHLTIGQVEFCDASAAHCTDIHLLGVAQLTSAGTATLKFRPGVGSRSYKAIFPGTNAYAGSTSAVSALTVTGIAGPFATTTTITESGSAGNYALTAAVTEAGETTGPAGSVSFLDANHANAVLGTETLGAAVAGVSWSSPSAISSLGIRTVAVTDLNGDGIADLVVNANPVVIFLGHADGTYTEAPALPSFGPTEGAMAVADFNADGIPDLAVGMYSSADVAILLGNGDGTFRSPIEAALPSNAIQVSQIVSADFNGDGVADLLVVDNYNSVLAVLLGAGNGTFRLAAAPSYASRPSAVAVGDFNGDGIPDFAVSDS